MEEGGGDDCKEASIGENKTDLEEKEIDNPTPFHPQRTWYALLLHASIMGGREFLYAVEIVLVTPIILHLGMPEKYYSFMWCFSPIIGVLIGPVLGSSSDRCKSRFGRRRPYIVTLVIGAIIGLTFLIYSEKIALRFGGPNAENRKLWGIVVAVIGAQLMDFCLDQTETPLRAYTLDVCSPKDQQRAFTLQTIFIGIGGALGFIVDGIDWDNTVLSNIIGPQIEVVYVFALFAYLISALCNLFSIKEIPLMKNSSSTSCNTTITKRIVTSQLLRKSKSFQFTPCSDGSTQTTLNDLRNGNPCILVSICEDERVEKEEKEKVIAIPGREICSLPLISLNKGLYISTSCPGGLEESNAESSFSSPTNDDSTFEEGSNLKSSCSLEGNNAAVSLPSLQTKKPTKVTRGKSHDSHTKVTRGKSLIDLIRAKEFSIRNIRTRNKVLDISHSEIKNAEKIPNINSEKPIDRLLLDSSSVHAYQHTDALLSHKQSAPISDVVIEFPYFNSGPENCSNGHANGTLNNTKPSKKNEVAVPVSFKQLWLSIVIMPSQLKWLCLTQLLGFIGFETLMLWYTDLMGRVVYKGDPQGAKNSTELMLYNDGVKMGCWGLAIYSVAMIMFSVFMDRMRILKRFSIRYLYSLSFLLMSSTMLLMFLFTNRYVILSLSLTIGISVAVLLTVPYVLVGKYHLIAKYVMKSPANTKRGFGLDCGILACQMYGGNVISASISSPIIFLTGSFESMFLITCTCNFLAFLFAYFLVTYPGEGKSRCPAKMMIERSTETI